MSKDLIPKDKNLKNKPLAEVIFELRWDLMKDDRGLKIDPGFRILLGRYYEEVKETYPYSRDLPSAQIPEDMAAYTVRHQFRASEEGWPVTQLGPGVLTVNETSGYKWKSFKEHVGNAINALFKAYPDTISSLSPKAAELRYINAIAYDPDKETPVQFLKHYLNMDIVIDKFLFEDNGQGNDPKAFTLNLIYRLPIPRGDGMLKFQTGLKDGKTCLIWEIVVRSLGDDIAKDSAGIKKWITESHDLCERWFFTLSRGKLVKQFKGEEK